MNLTDIQQNAVRQWVAEGDSISRVQTRLAEEFGVHMSYMDVRLLILDLDAVIQDAPEPAPKPAPDESAADAAEDDGDALPPESGAEDPFGPATGDVPPPSSVKVELSRIAKPGFALCGDVTFSDGTKAQWGITSRGELALDGCDPNYRPSNEDVREFQLQLRSLIQSGY